VLDPVRRGVAEFIGTRPLAPVPVGPEETGVREPRPGETAAS